MSDRPQRRFARPEDVSTDYERDLGDPGSFPYTRGIHRDMYAARPWSIRQYAGFGTAEETNRRFRFLIERGQPGLSTAFDLPTQMGLDSDDPRSLGEVGRVGVAVDSVADMERMFDDIPLDEVSTSMTINAPAPVLVAMYYVACERQGRDPAAIRGTAQNDVLKEYVARGTYIYPPAPSLRLAADLIAWCALEAPRFNAISLSGYHMREAGCTAAQEMGFALANALAYVQAVVDRGVAVDDFAPRLSWIFNTQMDFFEEIAKYRALRRMWAHIVGDRFGAQDPRSAMLRTHTQTAGSALTLQPRCWTATTYGQLDRLARDAPALGPSASSAGSRRGGGRGRAAATAPRRRGRLRPAPGDQVEAGVGGDPVEPGPERRPALEGLPAPPGPEERLLHGVLGVLERPEHPVAVDVQLTAVALGQVRERALVDLAQHRSRPVPPSSCPIVIVHPSVRHVLSPGVTGWARELITRRRRTCEVFLVRR